MKNCMKILTSVLCLMSLTGLASADGTSGTGSWSDWKHDDRVLQELYVRSRCTQDPVSPKKGIWEIQFKDIGDSLVEVKGKDFKYDIPAHYQSAGSAQIVTKSCSKMPEVKMDGGVPSKGYGYKLTYKDGSLAVKPHEKVDWGSWISAGMMGAAAAAGTAAENDAKIADIRAQQQAEQQAAAQARALQLAQMQAAQEQAQAAATERAAAQRLAQEAAQLQAQEAAQQAANQRAAQAAAQAERSRSSSNASNTNSGFAPGSNSSTPNPQPSDLGIPQNYVDSCNNGQTLAHFELSNASYSNAQMVVEFDYQIGGVTSSFTETHNLRPRSTNDYSHTIPCGGEPQLSDFGGRSNIVQFQFY